MKKYPVLAFLAGLIPAAALAQTYQNFIVDPSPAQSPLEKAIGYFTSTSVPSVIVSSDTGGYYLYQSKSGTLGGPWSRSTIDPSGVGYERARPFLYPGDTYPGLIASRSNDSGGYELVWYYNPMNWGGDPTQPWYMQVINPNAGCHDIQIVDLDGDGKPDIVCSAVLYSTGTQAFIAYQNTYNSWQIVNNPFQDASGNGIGDSVAIASIAGASRNSVIGATPTGVYWFQNPGARNGHWTPHYIGNGGTNAGVNGTVLNTVPYGGTSDAVVVGSNEDAGAWYPGLVAFFAGADPTQPWATRSLDASYRVVHEISSGNLGGTPFFIIAEQEQASNVCNNQGWNFHPSVRACRVTLFEYQAGTFVPKAELASLGSHNQQYVDYNGGIAVVGANHNVYGATDPALYIWYVTPGQTQSSGSLPNGTYRITINGSSVDGGFGYWSGYPSVELYPNNDGPCQKWTWNGANFLNNCPDYGRGPWIGHYMADGNDGSVSEPTGVPNTWSITASGSGWIVRNNRTHNYLSDNGGTLGMSANQTVWTIGAQ